MKNSAKRSSKSSIEYLGLDTETIDGYCRLLCLSDECAYPISSFKDVMDFFRLYLKATKTYYFFAWNADFDIQALLKYFPKRILNALLKGVVLEYEDKRDKFTIQYIKGKYFSFGNNYIFDAYQYYHSSLKDAAKKYLGEDEQKGAVDASKIDESNILSPEVVEYCKRDALLALKLFNKFHAALPQKLEGTKPISNAFYSYSYFRRELTANRPKADVNAYFRNAYHGGRFEIFERGHFGKLYVYDINSAYPFEISRLRSLINARYLNCPSYMPDASYSVLKVRVNVKNKFAGPLLMKDKGLCIYPAGIYEGYITKGEYEAVRDWKPEILEGFHIFGKDDHPFEDKVAELYDLKKRSGFPLPFKIILNSLYGKTGQATPKYVDVRELDDDVDVLDYVDEGGVTYVKFEDIRKSNFVYASEITARTRLRMYEAIDPRSCVMVQTDSVISKRPLDLPLSDKLGDWKKEEWDEAYLIGSGVYFYRVGNSWAGKFRGFNFKHDKVVDILERLLQSKEPKVAFETKKRYSIQEAKRLHQEELGNQILDVTRSLNINFDRKRLWLSDWASGTEIKKKNIASLALYHTL